MGIKNDKELKAVCDFLSDLSKKGKSEVVCPFCGKKLVYDEFGSSYEVKCQTEGCLDMEFRGI